MLAPQRKNAKKTGIKKKLGRKFNNKGADQKCAY